MIRPHIGSKLTQGSIFSCAQAEDYAGCPVHGLVITARCDITHDKAAVFNYLPVVRFDDWIHRDFLSILLTRSETDAQQQFINLLKGNNISERVFATHSPHQIASSFFPEQTENKTLKKARPSAIECVRRFDLIERTKKSTANERMALTLAAEYPKLKDRIIKECVHQQLPGYYFLPRIEIDGQDTGFLILMREVRHIPRELAAKVAIGLDNADYALLCTQHSIPPATLTLSQDEFSYCLGRLDSPVVEHLMQSFSLLFGRIGLPDPDAEYIAQLWQKQPSTKDGSK